MKSHNLEMSRMRGKYTVFSAHVVKHKRAYISEQILERTYQMLHNGKHSSMHISVSYVGISKECLHHAMILHSLVLLSAFHNALFCMKKPCRVGNRSNVGMVRKPKLPLSYIMYTIQ